MDKSSSTKMLAKVVAFNSIILNSHEPIKKRKREWYNPKPADPQKKKKRKMAQASKRKNRK